MRRGLMISVLAVVPLATSCVLTVRSHPAEEGGSDRSRTSTLGQNDQNSSAGLQPRRPL